MTLQTTTGGRTPLGMSRVIRDLETQLDDCTLIRFSAENFPNILKLVDGLKGLGEKHHATAGQVTLAWLLAQGEDIIPIPGTKKIKVHSHHPHPRKFRCLTKFS